MPLRAVLFALFVLTVAAMPARAEGDPRTVIQAFSDQLLDVMKRGPTLQFAGRRDKLLPVIASTYDMVSVTRSTLGVAGSKLSPEDAQKIADAYTRYSAATYADQFIKWGGERFEVDPGREAQNGLILVPSRIVPASGAPVSIDYLMKDDGGAWRIVDVLFDGAISQVAVRRSEILPIFRRDGVAGVVGAFDAKSQALAGK